jgi:hypothetical protein
LGFRLNHTAQNLQTIAKSLQFDKVAERIENAGLIDHLNTSWMWGSPLFTFKPILQEGHYIAFAVHPL